MALDLELDNEQGNIAQLKVVGVGGRQQTAEGDRPRHRHPR